MTRLVTEGADWMGTPYMGIFSDLHVLSRFGLVPPRFRLAGGSTADPCAKYQEYMWECWSHTCSEAPEMDVAVFNGDTYDGEDRLDRAAWVVSTDMADQYSAAVETIGMIRNKVKKLYFTRGTPYHEGKASETLEGIAKELGAEFIDAPTRRTVYVLDLKWRGLLFNFTHHMTKGWMYRGTASTRTAMLALIASAEGKVNRPDVFVRSHLHMKHIAYNNGIWGILTPAYQVVKPYAIKVMEYYRAQVLSELGCIILTVSDDGSVSFPFDKKFTYQNFREAIVDADSETRTDQRP